MKLNIVLLAMALSLTAAQAQAKAYTKETAKAAAQEAARTKANKLAQSSKDECPFKNDNTHSVLLCCGHCFLFLLQLYRIQITIIMQV